ncbi:PAAR-like domain-containing protein [Enterobacter sp.]|uniref:PAAR-like domain-containing protein n=1 Tax=Enterobacter sp. TaxID=42895 RepID=UPI00296F1FCC|nr:PAAR-like domain-containing protein [Enterobacter sp.]
MAEKHIGSRESQYVVVSIAPDVCQVGDAVVPFDSFQDLSHEKSYISNVRARGNPILTVDSIIAGTQSNAGKGVSSGTSQGSGDCRIVTGVNHIKCKGKSVARHDSLVAMNNDNTVGKLYTQVNPANPEISVENTSYWERYFELQRQMHESEMEARTQQPDVIIGLAKEFANGWYTLGVLLGKGQMQSNVARMDADIAMMQTMGMDTQSLEQASETNKKTIDAINPEERLFDPANDVQEMSMEVEPYLELLAGLAAVTKGAAKLAGKSAGRAGRNGVKITILSDKKQLTKAKIKAYLFKIKVKSRNELINDLKTIGLKIKGQSPDGRFIEFVDKNGVIRAKIHPADKVTKYDHIHIYDKTGHPLDSDLNVVDFRSSDAHIEIEGINR